MLADPVHQQLRHLDMYTVTQHQNFTLYSFVDRTRNTPVLSLGAARAAAVASSSPAPPAAHRSHLRQQTIMINVINCEYRNEAHRLCPLLMGQTCSIYQLFKHGSNLSASSHSAV
eukprot:scaffold79688_cov19-Tisochrysis_lutea.AAC.1